MLVVVIVNDDGGRNQTRTGRDMVMAKVMVILVVIGKRYTGIIGNGSGHVRGNGSDTGIGRGNDGGGGGWAAMINSRCVFRLLGKSRQRDRLALMCLMSSR